MKSPRSLVLITVDCFRADHAGFLGYPLPTTPFLDSLATESLTFSNAIVAGAPTYFSFPAVMASRHPLGLGRDVVGLAPGEPTIASALNEAGHATAAFLAANPYLSPRFGYDAGFSVFQDFLDSAAAPVPGVADEREEHKNPEPMEPASGQSFSRPWAGGLNLRRTVLPVLSTSGIRPGAVARPVAAVSSSRCNC